MRLTFSFIKNVDIRCEEERKTLKKEKGISMSEIVLVGEGSISCDEERPVIGSRGERRESTATE